MPATRRGLWLLCASSALLSGCGDFGPETRTRPSDNQLSLSQVRLANARNPGVVVGVALGEDQCSQLDADVRQLSSMTANTFKIEAGKIDVIDDLWVKLSPEQQQQVMGLAAQKGRCEDGDGAVVVRELRSGAVLARVKPPE